MIFSVKNVSVFGALLMIAAMSMPPRTIFVGFGDSSLNFQLRAWTGDFDTWVVIKSDLTLGVHDVLKEAGIAIPFPQRDLHVVS